MPCCKVVGDMRGSMVKMIKHMSHITAPSTQKDPGRSVAWARKMRKAYSRRGTSSWMFDKMLSEYGMAMAKEILKV